MTDDPKDGQQLPRHYEIKIPTIPYDIKGTPIFVRDPLEFREALKQNVNHIVIEDRRINARIFRIEIWKERKETRDGLVRHISNLIFFLLVVAMALGYGVKFNWYEEWDKQKRETPSREIQFELIPRK
jgi:hypothetical protein